MHVKKTARGIRFSTPAAHRPSVYELRQQISDLDMRFREHVEKEESFWTDMEEMKLQIKSMFLAATWVVKLTKTLFAIAITVTPLGVAAYSYISRH